MENTVPLLLRVEYAYWHFWTLNTENVGELLFFFFCFNVAWLQDSILNTTLDFFLSILIYISVYHVLNNLTKYKTMRVKRSHGHLKTWQFKRVLSKGIYQMLLRPKRQVSVRLRYTITFCKNGWFMIKRIFPFVRILRLKKTTSLLLFGKTCIAAPYLLQSSEQGSWYMQLFKCCMQVCVTLNSAKNLTFDTDKYDLDQDLAGCWLFGMSVFLQILCHLLHLSENVLWQSVRNMDIFYLISMK